MSKQRERLQKPEPEGVGTDWGCCFQVGAEAQKTRGQIHSSWSDGTSS